MRYSFLILFLFIFSVAYGGGEKTTTSITNGNWCLSSTWNNGIPDESKDVINISSDDSVNATCITTLIIGSQATLRINGCGILVVQNLQFNNGSIIYIDSCATLIVLGNLNNQNNSNNVFINGTLIVNGNLQNGNGGIISGEGSISASTYSGECCVMGFDPDTIPAGSVIIDSLIDGPSLPIELLYFKGEYYDMDVDLEWATITEANSEYFIIDKTYDFVYWKTVGIKSAAGNSNSLIKYSYHDEYEPSFIYYRLTQFDFDGKCARYQPIAISLHNLNVKKTFKIYPNPTKIGQYIIICCTEVKLIEVFTLYGSLIKTLYDTQYIDGLEKGIYTIRLNGNESNTLIVE